jgi:hypothetical protein
MSPLNFDDAKQIFNAPIAGKLLARTGNQSAGTIQIVGLNFSLYGEHSLPIRCPLILNWCWKRKRRQHGH